jgi:hypothetical protein
MKICSAHERASMPGLLDTGEVARLGSTEGSTFDALFLDLMTSQGGGSNGEFAFRDGSDSRLRMLAHAIRHEQQGEMR